MIYLGIDDIKSAANGAAVSARTKDQTSSNLDINVDNLTKRKDDMGRTRFESGNNANDLTERRPSFHLGGNDDDLSDDSIPTTSPAAKHTGDDDSSKRDSSLSRLTSASSLRRDNFLSLAAKTATTSASSSTVKPDDKVAQDRFMQYQKQAKLKAEQEKLYKEQEAKKREDEAKQARLLSRKETNGNHVNETSCRNSTKQTASTLSDASPSPPSMHQNSLSASLNPQQEMNMDDEQRQKREIAKRREEDRRRRECQALNQSLPFNRHTDVDFSFMNG
ncbi:unnamed protein product [Rotaria socialis]|uniref:Uncharacterized protein n=1 Tax=Rotaria socialis TaxID=392032 RepID=A0A820SEY7_9BILA|nr:unnamed protein product [Rotaria socialis]